MKWTLSIPPLLEGFGIGSSLIIAIGSQNVFVLRQGIKRKHVFLTAFISSCLDIILITVGVAGLGTLISRSPILITAAIWGGAIFLTVYGFLAFQNVFKTRTMPDPSSKAHSSAKKVILLTAAFSLLNPHVYLDTVVLLGSVGAHFPYGQRPSFILGASIASFVWFFLLAYGASWMTPLFKKPITWKCLDASVGIIMWSIAVSLILSE